MLNWGGGPDESDGRSRGGRERKGSSPLGGGISNDGLISLEGMGLKSGGALSAALGRIKGL